MRNIFIVLLVFIGLTVQAQLPASTFKSRIFTGNTEASWIILDSPLVNPVLDTFYARYAGTQIVRIQGGDTALWFYGGNRRWFRGLLDRDTISLSNRINLKQNQLSNAGVSGDSLYINNAIKRIQNDYGLTFSTNATKILMFVDTLGSNHVVTTSQLKDTAAAIRAAIGGGGSGLTSVGLSMPSAFTVTNSPLTVNGTLNVSGAGTTAQYVRGNGTLATTDTGMIPNFYLKVRSLISNISPITYNSTTGEIGINNATTTGTKGAATFASSDFSDNGLGTISLADKVLAGTCVNCQITFNAKGQATSFANGTPPQFVNASGAGDTLSINDTLKRLNPGFGILHTVTANNITQRVDTSVIATQYDLTQIPSIAINNIGAGFRWLATPSGNFKTAFGSNTIIVDSSSNSNALTFKVDTASISTLFDLSLTPKVYNVTDPIYGAKGDGRKVFDAAISASSSTLTSASANFTSADVGKAIRVPYAGSAGVDLITTISGFTNSTTVTLTNAASTTVSADTVVWGTDNTSAFQKALDSCHHYGGGKVWVPNGVYMFAGALRTNVNGVNVNSQVVLPNTFFTGASDSSFNNRTHIIIEGETPPEWTPNLLSMDSIVSWKGVILYSLINGTGNDPALFSTKSRANASDSLNYTTYTFKNISILVSKNIHVGGPSMGGINCYWCNTSHYNNVMVAIDGSASASVRPTNEVAGIITNKIFSETMTTLERVHVAGFKYGIAVSDHANIDQCEVYFCDKAFVFLHNIETVHANRVLAQWNISSIYVPSGNIMGLSNSFGNAYFKIDNFMSEVWNGDAPGWYNYSYVLDDVSNLGIGDITYLIDQAGCCVNNSLFNKNGGTQIICKQLGAYEDNAWAKVSSSDLQSRNTGNVGIGGTPSTKLHVTTSTTGFGEVRVNNSNASGQVGFQAVNDGSLTGGIRVKGSSGGTYGAYVSNSTAYYSNATGGMAIMLDANADITLSAGAGGPPPVRLRVAGSNGAVTFNNAFTFPTSDGSSGQVLQTNGSGTVTWQTPSTATTLYSGDGTLAGNRTVTGSSNSLTFNSMFNYRINGNAFILDGSSTGHPYTFALIGAGNSLEIGFTPTATVYDKGAGLIIDTNNNAGLGTSVPTTAPLYTAGNSTFVNGFQSGRANFLRVDSVVTNTTVNNQEYFFVINAAGGNITMTLPAASTVFGSGMGVEYMFKRVDNSGNTVTVQVNGSTADLIDGASSFTIVGQYTMKAVQCGSATNWWVR